MPDTYHDHRADRAAAALEAYRSALGESRVDIDTVRDLAQDLLHWIAREIAEESVAVFFSGEKMPSPGDMLQTQVSFAISDFPAELAAGPDDDQGDETPIGEPPQDDTVKCCPDCERPNQFGEICPACAQADQERIEEAREQPEEESGRCNNCGGLLGLEADGDLCAECAEGDDEEAPAQEADEYKCPACGEVGNVDVEIKCWARVCYGESGEFTGTVPDDAERGEHEWGDESGMVCRACGHQGKV